MLEFNRCYIPLNIPRSKYMSLFKNQCEGGGASQTVTQTIYIKQLIIFGGVNGEPEIMYKHSFFQKIKSFLGIYPNPEEIIRAVKTQMLR